jgi:hypothetical protein
MAYICEWYQEQQYHQIAIPSWYQKKVKSSFYIPEWYHKKMLSRPVLVATMSRICTPLVCPPLLVRVNTSSKILSLSYFIGCDDLQTFLHFPFQINLKNRKSAPKYIRHDEPFHLEMLIP